MTQLIIDALFHLRQSKDNLKIITLDQQQDTNKEQLKTTKRQLLAISVLLAVSPAFKSALPPWYITKYATAFLSHRISSAPMTWNTVKFLHSVSPFSFQFTTSLCVKIDTKRELNAFVSSDAMKCLFGQLQKLSVDLEVISTSTSNLALFIQQFGMLRRFRLFLMDRENITDTLNFFREVLSSEVITRNHSLTLDLVTAFQTWLCCASRRVDRKSKLFAFLSKLTVDYFPRDDGRSFLVFFNCIVKIATTTAAWHMTDKNFMKGLTPLFDLIEKIILNGDFNNLVLRSRSFVEDRNKEFCFNPVCSSDTIILDVSWNLLDLIEKCLESRDRDVASRFVRKYGQTFIKQFARIVFDSRKDSASGRVHPYLISSKKDTLKIERYFETNMKLFSLFNDYFSKNDEHRFYHSSIVTVTNDDDDDDDAADDDDLWSPLDIFPFDVFCDFLDCHSFEAAARLSPILSWLVKTIRTSGTNPATLVLHQDSVAKLARKLFEFFKRIFDHNNRNNFEEMIKYNVVAYRCCLYNDDFIPLIDGGLSKLLFGFDNNNLANDDDDNSNNNKSFHKYIRQSFFGTENLQVVDEVFHWAERVVSELATKMRTVEAFIEDLDNNIKNDAACRRINGIRTFAGFIEVEVCSFLKKVIRVVIDGDFRDWNNNNPNNSNTSLQPSSSSAKLVRILDAKVTIANFEKLKRKLELKLSLIKVAKLWTKIH